MTGLSYSSGEIFRADWHTANDEVVDVPAEVEVPSVDVRDVDDLALLLEKYVGWTQDIGSVDHYLVEMSRQYRDELASLKLSAPRTPLEAVKIGRELPSSNIALGVRLGKAESLERDAQAARKAADSKLAKASNNAD